MQLTKQDYQDALGMAHASNMGAIAHWLLEKLPAIGEDEEVEQALLALIDSIEGAHLNLTRLRDSSQVYNDVGRLYYYAYGRDGRRRAVAEHPIARLAIQVIGNILGRQPFWTADPSMYSEAVYGAQLAIHLVAEGVVEANRYNILVLTLDGKPDIWQKSHAWHYLRAHSRHDYFEYEFEWLNDDTVQLIGRYYER